MPESHTSYEGTEHHRPVNVHIGHFDQHESHKKKAVQEVKISTENVHVYYGETEAIKGIDLNNLSSTKSA